MFKNSILLSLAVLLVSSCQNKNPQINGTLSGADWEKVYMYNMRQSGAIDSAHVINGKFIFDLSDKVNELVYIGKNRTSIAYFLSKNNQSLKIEVQDNNCDYQSEGNVLNDRLRQMHTDLRSCREYQDYQEVAQKMRECQDDELRASYMDKYQEKYKLYATYALNLANKVIEENKNNALGLYVFYRQKVNYKDFYDKSMHETIMHEYRELLKYKENYVYAAFIEKEMNKWQTAFIGNKMPEITGVTPDGKELKLSDLRGNYVLVDFWASWCGWCRKENPYLKEAIKQAGVNHFKILGVSFDASEEKWLEAIEEDQSTWHQILVTREQEKAVKSQLCFSGIPFLVLVSPDGEIAAVKLRGEQLVSTIKNLK